MMKIKYNELFPSYLNKLMSVDMDGNGAIDLNGVNLRL